MRSDSFCFVLLQLLRNQLQISDQDFGPTRRTDARSHAHESAEVLPH
jgi:hypothetical protein